MSLDTFERLPAQKRELIVSTGIRAFSQSSYTDVSTDAITRECRISKGILFHYFGSKKGFYLYCLERSLDRLTQEEDEAVGDDFYQVLFAEMDRKMALCVEHRDEMHLVNMASRDASAEIADDKAALMGRYSEAIGTESERMLGRALAALRIEDEERRQMAAEGLRLYIGAILNRYLLAYQETPDEFFEGRERIEREMKGYLDLMLYGICG